MQIAVIIIALVAVAMTFFRKMPACLMAYIAYVMAGFGSLVHPSIEQYIIWGIIAVADTVNIYATRMVPSPTMHLYVVVGTLVGCVLGWVAGSLVAVMIAGALGAILAFLAFSRTPKGRGLGAIPISHRLTILAGAACTPWFTYILLASLPIFN